MPKARLELARPLSHTPLKRACLPIPPLRRGSYLYWYEHVLSIERLIHNRLNKTSEFLVFPLYVAIDKTYLKDFSRIVWTFICESEELTLICWLQIHLHIIDSLQLFIDWQLNRIIGLRIFLLNLLGFNGKFLAWSVFKEIGIIKKGALMNILNISS